MGRFAPVRIKAGTALDLGVLNLARAGLYRLGLRTGLHPVCRLRAKLPEPPYFAPPTSHEAQQSAPDRSGNTFKLFDWHAVPIHDTPPDWLQNPFTGATVGDASLPWWRIPDFNPDAGDIKAVWEWSRFHWVLGFAQDAVRGDETAIPRLNQWMGDWCANNPAYCGPNWKCGQEAAIRVMHLAMAAVVLQQERQPCPGLLELVQVHLRRIAPTMSYAVAQDNNHGTSEAAALWIGGSWLDASGCRQGRRWQRKGRMWLENRVQRLVTRDGSFSQHSVNYHRVLLDTLSVVELWRCQNKLTRFSQNWYEHTKAAAHWLYAMTDARTGDAPNLGANDGARLLPLTDTDYRDYRPSVQLGTVLFDGVRAYAQRGPWDEPLSWMKMEPPPRTKAAPISVRFDAGGYAILRTNEARCVVRYPRYRFRPSHADALHLDLWVCGNNHLRDGGSYSYGASAAWADYFRGTQSHNTIQFDDRDQMPKLGRFLYGAWLRTLDVFDIKQEEERVQFSAAYRDRWGAQHHRHVELDAQEMQVTDRISGFQRKAILRWRLLPAKWTLEAHTVRSDAGALHVTGSMTFNRFALVEGWESRYYLHKTTLPVLEVEVEEPGVLETRYRWVV